MNLTTTLATRCLANSFAAIALLTIVATASAADTPKSPEPKAKASATATVTTTDGQTNILIFRNNRSWNRKTDFEEALTELGHKHVVKPSAEMSSVDLSTFHTVIIPGAQRKDDFYGHYMENAEMFDRFVTNGGTLVLELNGAENAKIPLPRGVSMVRHGAKDNAITLAKHPLVDPLGGQTIHATFASHGFLENVPKDALILAVEMENGKPDMNKPTYAEYRHGKGRVIAACQCFHDQDGSGRGILMETAVTYAADRQWYTPAK